MKEYRYFFSYVHHEGYGHKVFTLNRKIESNNDLDWVMCNIIKKDCVILNFQLMKEIDGERTNNIEESNKV